MIDHKGKFRCDAEIGNAKKGWHSCMRLAVCECEQRRYNPPMSLHFCRRHKARATKEDRVFVRELS